MKKIIIPLMAVLMSFGTSAFAGTKTANSQSLSASSLSISIPEQLIVKQTVTFTDGSTVTVFYQKDGNMCRIYSDTDITKYKEADLNRIKSTNFELTDHVEGRCILTKKTRDVIALAKSLLK